jgi:hypothetical protein
VLFARKSNKFPQKTSVRNGANDHRKAPNSPSSPESVR